MSRERREELIGIALAVLISLAVLGLFVALVVATVNRPKDARPPARAQEEADPLQDWLMRELADPNGLFYPSSR